MSDIEQSVEIDGLSLRRVTIGGAVSDLRQRLDQKRGTLVLTHNLEHLHRFHSDPEFARSLADVDYAVADGMPLVWASQILGYPLPERVSGIDLMMALLESASDGSMSMCFFGGHGDTAAETRRMALELWPNLDVALAHSPPDQLAGRPDVAEAEMQRVAESGAQVVFVGLPTGLQLSMGLRLRELMPDALIIGVGVSFSFFVGQIPRAPRALRSLGLEWVWRLAFQPKELAGRYLQKCLPLGVSLLVRSVLERFKTHAEMTSIMRFREVVAADAYRCDGNSGLAAIIRLLLTRRTFRVVFTHRLVSRAGDFPLGMRAIFHRVARLLHRFVSGRASIDLPWEAKIGPGLLLLHGWGLVVAPEAILGSNVTLFHGVTVGRGDRISVDGERTIGIPVLGDAVWVGPNATIVGDLDVGDGSRVLAGAILSKSVPAKSMYGAGLNNHISSDVVADVVNRAEFGHA